MDSIGLLIMAYGTPRTLDDLEPYYTHIRGGEPPTAELLKQLRRRYVAIGGSSPLLRITRDQASALEAQLRRRGKAVRIKTYLGMKHAAPFIEDAVHAMHADGIQRALALVMAPHHSDFSTRRYAERAERAARGLGSPRIEVIPAWYQQPKFIAYWARQIRTALASLPADQQARALVVFSAHSLPLRVANDSDPYPGQVEASARQIAAAAGIQQYVLGWQSAGRTQEPWLGPDIRDLTGEMADCAGYQVFIYCPIGFVSDHLEVLYDNDIECRAVAEEHGARYLRPAMPNMDPLFIAALGDAVCAQIDNPLAVPA